MVEVSLEDQLARLSLEEELESREDRAEMEEPECCGNWLALFCWAAEVFCWAAEVFWWDAEVFWWDAEVICWAAAVIC